MEKINSVGKLRLKTVICSFRELPDIKEIDFCKELYSLTENADLDESVFKIALQEVNKNKPYDTTRANDDPVNKIRSWIDCLRFFKTHLTEQIIERIGDVSICFEYCLNSRWVDAVIVCNDKIIVLEFKSGESTDKATLLGYINQINSYYNRIRHCVKGVANDIAKGCLSVEKYLVFTNDAVIDKVEEMDNCIITSKTFEGVLASATNPCIRERLEYLLDSTSYIDPTITGTFSSLLTEGVVNYVEANSQNIEACKDIINRVPKKATRELRVILVKGGPGTGKTGTAFTLLRDYINAGYTQIQYVTGNNNLEKYFSSIVDETAKKNKIHEDLNGIAGSVIERINRLYNPKNYCDVFLHRKPNVNPVTVQQSILLVDEAQRLWNSLNIAVRSRFIANKWADEYEKDEQDYIYANDLSETYLLLFGAIQGMINQPVDKQDNKCIIFFLGNGQEINNGEENGEEDVLRAIGAISHVAKENGISLKVYTPEQQDEERLRQFHVATEIIPELMLINNKRNDEGDPQLNIINSILEGDNALSEQQNLYRIIDDFQDIEKSFYHAEDGDYSIGLLVNSYDTWGYGRDSKYSFIDVKNGKKYSFSGIGQNLYDFFHERGCNRLKEFATQFDSQGLELDNTVVIWGNTLLWRNNEWTVNDEKVNGKCRMGSIWSHCKKVNDLIGKKSLDYNEVKKQFVINAYRVLLTRARQSTYLYVQDEETRNHLKALLENCQ